MAETYAGAIDRGLEGVVACTTGVSSIVDATLCYRGFTIEDLAANSSFEEIVFLLWNDRLPNSDELKTYETKQSEGMALNSELIIVLKSVPT